MKSLFCRGLITLLFFSSGAWGSTSSPKTTAKVQFDQTFYDLEFSRHIFTYKESTRSYIIKIKKCNQQKVRQIETTYKSLLKAYSHQPPRKKTKYDVNLSANNKNIKVARGSHFGTWLREMPQKIMYINAEAQGLQRIFIEPQDRGNLLSRNEV